MLYRATKKFLELGVENNYQFLTCEEYFALRRGEAVECKPRPYLLEGGYVEPASKKRKGEAMSEEPEVPVEEAPEEEKDE
jgi:hypothetical protein